MKDLPLSFARGRLLLGQGLLLKLHVYPAWCVSSLGWHPSVLWLCNPPLMIWGLWVAGIPRRDLKRTLEWKDKLAKKPSNFSFNPYSSFQPLHPAFQRQNRITGYKSVFRTGRYISYMPLLSLNFPIYKAYVISPFFIHPIECRDGRMRYGRRERCVNSKCPLLVSVSSFHCPAPWSHSPA